MDDLPVRPTAAPTPPPPVGGYYNAGEDMTDEEIRDAALGHAVRAYGSIATDFHNSRRVLPEEMIGYAQRFEEYLRTGK